MYPKHMVNADKRKYRRFPASLKAQYTIHGTKKGRCEITDISREGMSILLNLDEKLISGTKLELNINLPSKSHLLSSQVNLKWIKKASYKHLDFNYKAGGQFISIDADTKTCLLEYAYDEWFRNI